MTMKRIVIILLASLLLAGHAKAQKAKSAASSTPVDSVQLKKAQDEQNDLKKKKKELKQELKKEKSSRNSLLKLSKKVKAEIGKYKKAIEKAEKEQQTSEYAALDKKKMQLADSIKESEATLDSLEKEIATIDDELAGSNHEKNELDRVRESIRSGLITENDSYLELPFSQQTPGRLDSIHQQCRPYTSDWNIKEFSGKIKNAIDNKACYDSTLNVLESRYDSVAVSLSLEKAESMKGLSIAQKEEVDFLKNQLKAFPEGLRFFRQLIDNINRKREGINYSKGDFEDDVKAILLNDEKDKIISVPYLKGKFDKYIKDISKRPNEHSDVEAEILNQ